MEGVDKETPIVIPIDKVGDENSYRPKKGITKKILEVGHGLLFPKSPSIVSVSYKGYVTSTKEIFDEVTEKIVLGDQNYPEGFTTGMENMRKGEHAIIEMKRKYGFKEEKVPERLKAKTKMIANKGLTYEVKLLDAIIRMDLNGDKKIIKTVVKEGISGKVPAESDEVLSISIGISK